MICTAAHHQGAIKMSWLHSWGALMLSIFTYSGYQYNLAKAKIFCVLYMALVQCEEKKRVWQKESLRK